MDTYWHSCARSTQNIIKIEEEKVEKDQELAFEIRRIHGASKVTEIGALGTTDIEKDLVWQATMNDKSVETLGSKIQF